VRNRLGSHATVSYGDAPNRGLRFRHRRRARWCRY